ncbi:MAG: hypothetical protein EOM68_15200 [Spirochaetia bacterium]|nr:hypothetical protein [Spirochaetia bacterium]
MNETYEVHEALNIHVRSSKKKKISRCSCGEIFIGSTTRTEIRRKVEAGQYLNLDNPGIMATEDWVWLGMTKRNIHSNYVSMYQSGRKLWVHCSGLFQPLATWQGPGAAGYKGCDHVGRNSIVWKIAAARRVPIAIVLENTREQHRSWVRKNYKQWLRSERIEHPKTPASRIWRRNAEEARRKMEQEMAKLQNSPL